MANADQVRRTVAHRSQWMSGLRLASGAGARAEAAAIRTCLRDVGHELGAAVRAVASLSPHTGAVFADDENLVISDGALRVEDVAALAGRNEVVEGVVQRVPVEMVYDKDAFTAPASGIPLHRRSAVVARVGSATDCVVEDHAVLGHERPVQRKRMAGSVDHPAPGGLFFAPGSVGALLRTVLTRLCGDAGERCTALVTHVLHLAAKAVCRTRPGAEPSHLRSCPVAELDPALFALGGDVSTPLRRRTGYGAVLAELGLSATAVLAPTTIAIPRSSLHA